MHSSLPDTPGASLIERLQRHVLIYIDLSDGLIERLQRHVLIYVDLSDGLIERLQRHVLHRPKRWFNRAVTKACFNLY